MSIVSIQKFNEVFVQISAENHIVQELSDYFTFDVPNAKFHPLVRKRVWDGKIRLLNAKTNLIYTGLIPYIEVFCDKMNYKIQYEHQYVTNEFSIKEANDFIKTLKLPFVPRDYQVEGFCKAVRDSRKLLISPTGSGKSLIMYLLYRYFDVKTLLIVPTVGLVHQMYSDFNDYGYDSTNNITKIFSGQEENSDHQLYISTWQSIYKNSKEWFDQFDMVIVDEAHTCQAKSLVSIMTKLTDCKLRFGLTGTLQETLTHKLVLEGLFGTATIVATTSELIDKKHLSNFQVKNIVLTYPDKIKQAMYGLDYQTELDYIVTLEARNRFICNLALSLKGNTLIMFQFVEKHGKPLYQMITNMEPDRNIYFISGEIEGEERNEIRKIVETEDNAIIIASTGTTSTGVNIKRLHNMIFSSPSKARIKVLQSIGRTLRLSDDKETATLFDIADDLSWKGKANYTLNHFVERIKMYNSEKFKYKIYRVSLNL